MPPARRSRDALWLSPLLLAVLALLYTLSVGPALGLASAFDLGEQPIVTFYAPLVWLHQHTFLRQPLERYVRLWVDD